MSLDFVISPKLENVLAKLAKKDKGLVIALRKKIIQITNSDMVTVQHFKNLKGDMSSFKRVHIGNFVLIFRIEPDTIFFEDFSHHDDAYD